MSTMKQALIAAGIPVAHPTPSAAFWCLKVRANANCTVCGHPIRVGNQAKQFLCTDCRAHFQKRRAAGWST